jgi:biotin transporter BioY
MKNYHKEKGLQHLKMILFTLILIYGVLVTDFSYLWGWDWLSIRAHEQGSQLNFSRMLQFILGNIRKTNR